ncbi:aspartate-alanine antiporter [Anaeromyxobacter oryzae]|uniref:Transporter n=1 Tax=Anaeromyxobacter oryzae TaxID=2918170 RepID=A0ABM7WR32_9BACT|nr:aspartate-alanine antiporter [Anaeromyxobacter oryzae]BDG01932.1 putative transporter [Anaeromyxobacter oryzae]
MAGPLASAAEVLRSHPELALFLTLAMGFAVGRIRIGTFTVGSVLGTLLAGVLVGQLGVDVPGVVKVVFFDLFLFATGYKVGPQFFRGLKKDGLPQLALTVVVCVACLATAVIASKLLGYDVGTAAGLLAGAFTESTVIGTAAEAIQRLPLPDAERARLVNAIPVAYAVTYLVGTTTLVWFLSSLAPRLMRIDLRAAARELEVKLSGKAAEEEGVSSAYRDWDLRAFELGGPRRTVAQLEASLGGARAVVERVRSGGVLVDPIPETVVGPGDRIALACRREVLVAHAPVLGAEVQDRELLDFPLAVLQAVVTNRALAGRTLAELAAAHGRGVVLRKLVRSGQELPFEPGTVVNRGDLLEIAGHQRDAERAARALGYVVRPSPATDMVFVGLGIVLGGFVGLIAVKVGGVSITLTTSGGALCTGLLLGWLRSVSPTFGGIPEAALWIFDTVGLTTFIGAVGLAAGPGFVAGVRQTGPSLVLVAFVVAILPHVIGILFGRYVLRMNPVILLGAESGAGTTTAGLKALQDAADSKLPVLGYTVPYALGNILLTAWGPVIVALMT